MKRHYSTWAATAMAAAGFAIDAQAAYTFDPQADTLLLNFRKAGASSDFNVSLGSVTDYKAGLSLNISQYSASDLSSTFGGLGGLQWSLVGYKAYGSTADASVPEGTLYVTRSTETAWSAQNSFTMDAVGTKYGGIGGYAQNTGVDFSNTATKSASANSASYTGAVGASGNFGKASAFPGGVEATTPTAASWSQDLFLYQMVPSDVAYSGSHVQEVGKFTLASDGTMSFSAVPEPSTYGMIAAGGLMVYGFVTHRRRQKINA
jgi:hypothetical protein